MDKNQLSCTVASTVHRATGRRRVAFIGRAFIRFQQCTNDENAQKGARREERQNDD
jgi:hypothetical protein